MPLAGPLVPPTHAIGWDLTQSGHSKSRLQFYLMLLVVGWLDGRTDGFVVWVAQGEWDDPDTVNKNGEIQREKKTLAH